MRILKVTSLLLALITVYSGEIISQRSHSHCCYAQDLEISEDTATPNIPASSSDTTEITEDSVFYDSNTESSDEMPDRTSEEVSSEVDQTPPQETEEQSETTTEHQTPPQETEEQPETTAEHQTPLQETEEQPETTVEHQTPPQEAEEQPETTAEHQTPDEVNEIQDIHLQALTNLDIPEEMKIEAQRVAVESVEFFYRDITARQKLDFSKKELDRLNHLLADGGGLQVFINDLKVLEDPHFPTSQPVAKMLGKMIVSGADGPAQDINAAQEIIAQRVNRQKDLWKSLRHALVERRYLYFEISANRHIVAQLASLMSMDKRWFWLCGVLAFSVLFLVSLHERRHEIRRWLNGGRARQMGLSKLLGVGLGLLIIMTLITFIFGDNIYRAMLNVSFSAQNPRHEYTELVDTLKSQMEASEKEEKQERIPLNEAVESWEKIAREGMPVSSKAILDQWKQWRSQLQNIYVNYAILNAVTEQIEQDREQLKNIDGLLGATASQTANYLRLKHFLRVVLGLGLFLFTFIGIAAFWHEIKRRQRQRYNTCPLCLGEGCLVPCDENGNPFSREDGDEHGVIKIIREPDPEDEFAAVIQSESAENATGEEDTEHAASDGEDTPAISTENPLDLFSGTGGVTNMESPTVSRKFVRCEHVLRDNPWEECGYFFETQYRSMRKLSFPTLGIPQAGKTHWLTMLYWQIRSEMYPELGFSKVPSKVTDILDRRVEELINSRVGTAATQRDRIPQPLVIRYEDKDRLGSSDMLVNIFDYSGEVTSDMPLNDFRRQRALTSDGFFFFLDPTYPWKPQAEAVKRFRKDIRRLVGVKEGQELHLPIALCMTKIDLLPQVEALGDSYAAAMEFYEQLGKIDPTGQALSLNVIQARSDLTNQLRKRIWPDWDLETQITELFGGRHCFFPLTPVGLDGAGEADLKERTISPFGLTDPLAWLLEMAGYPTLDARKPKSRKMKSPKKLKSTIKKKRKYGR